MGKIWAGVSLACSFGFLLLQQTTNHRAGPSNHLFGILAGICVIIAGFGVAAQSSAAIDYGDDLLDKLPLTMQRLYPAYYIRKLFRDRRAYSRFNFIVAGIAFVLMGVVLTFVAIRR
jgi:hypothetical protein